ncbi:hypothetical protein [Vogesella indigofera]|uniref:hypothetical protein n=1 Tax=Vogesella indigofera TaxID=45465 RepID=UPI00234F8FE4|nr:hypothetical protein [Vogesella indigofera]MDC7707713.1 hypothetical protein [Vogesella indigofera]
MITILVDIAELRRRGLRNEAEAVEAVEESGSNCSPPSMPPAVIAGDDYSTAHGRGGAASEGASAGSAPAVPGPDAGQSAVDAGGSSAGHSAASTGPASFAQGGNAQDSAPAMKPEAHVKDQQTEHTPHIDPTEPLSGLHSARLRESLEREAFRNADTVAQDSAIAARAKTFAERADSGAHDPPSIDISRAAQDARIAVLNGEVPAWVRGNPELDPAILKVAEQASVRAPMNAPEQSSKCMPSQEHTSVPASTSGRELER